MIPWEPGWPARCSLPNHLTVSGAGSCTCAAHALRAASRPTAVLAPTPVLPSLLQGAVKTMVALAKADGKRGAAVTMLGKTVELAGHLVRCGLGCVPVAASSRGLAVVLGSCHALHLPTRCDLPAWPPADCGEGGAGDAGHADMRCNHHRWGSPAKLCHCAHPACAHYDGAPWMCSRSVKLCCRNQPSSQLLSMPLFSSLFCRP